MHWLKRDILIRDRAGSVFFNPFTVSPLLGREQLWVHLQQVLHLNHQIVLGRHRSLPVSLVKVLDMGQTKSTSFGEMIPHSSSVHHARGERPTDNPKTLLCIDLLVEAVESHLRERIILFASAKIIISEIS